MQHLSAEVIGLALLQPHQRNYKHHSAQQIADLKLSLLRFGQVRSIVVQEQNGTYITVAGHAIVQAAQELAYTHLTATIIPAEWSSSQVEGYLIADNEHAQKSTNDETLLAQLLADQTSAEYSTASLGIDETAINTLLAQLMQVELPNEQQWTPTPPPVVAASPIVQPRRLLQSDPYMSRDLGKESHDTTITTPVIDEPIGHDQPSEAPVQLSVSTLYEIAQVTIADPLHKVERGQVWRLGQHMLFCVDVFTNWTIWHPYLVSEDTIFAPFPGPFTALSMQAELHPLILVQPDTYIAGHILDRYAEAKGATSIRCIYGN